MSHEIDADLLADFITEASELTEQLDADLLELEKHQGDGEQTTALLNSAFRALHTIKGSASFLGLEALITFAHAAEEALNELRNERATVTAEVVDTLLGTVDVLSNMLDALRSGDDPPQCPDQLLAALRDIAATTGETSEPKAPDDAPAINQPQQDTAADSTEPASDDMEFSVQPLSLPSQKHDLLGFMAADLREQAGRLHQALELTRQPGQRNEAADLLRELAEEMSRTAEFFELDQLTHLVGLLGQSGDALPQLPDEYRMSLVSCLQTVCQLIEKQAEGLEQEKVYRWSLQTLTECMNALFRGEPVAADHSAQASADATGTTLLEDDAPPVGKIGQANTEPSVPAPAQCSSDSSDAGSNSQSNAAPKDAAAGTRRSGGERAAAEQTLRVEVSRLESLMNLVGQMVLTKNRVLAMSRRLQQYALPQELCEDVTSVANDLDRLTGSLQLGVMQTRMQPLSKLFDRYPRVIRDIARSTDKKIELRITGRETEVDKSVLELLGDPLVHILRNSADHGIENPDVRQTNGKEPTGEIHLSAEHQGSHVRIAIEDDGRGIDRNTIAAKAIEKGLTTEEQVASMSDNEVLQFIFAAGFSTTDTVSDLSGRGVGMDVVRTNVNQMNGSIQVHSESSKGTTIEILIPLTVAIMSAMVVKVADRQYCVPLQSISEIVQNESDLRHSVNGREMMRLRETVLPLIDLRPLLHPGMRYDEGRFVVVVGVGGQRAGLIVDGLVGQQEIVIKPLNEQQTKGGPFSGATIGEEGDVSLILDLVALLRHHAAPTQRLAA